MADDGSVLLRGQRISFQKVIKDLDHLTLAYVAQKAKVGGVLREMRTLVSFMGLVNRKRRQLAIRGVFINGMWVDDPYMVKIWSYWGMKSHQVSDFMVLDVHLEVDMLFGLIGSSIKSLMKLRICQSAAKGFLYDLAVRCESSHYSMGRRHQCRPITCYVVC
uniref:Uncharacterized protein n=1 Tax=Lactuca sativa TaxID=4236 RepID=A0A9R1VA64_LACSA|nr:hypothetical protein LSAT_V11C600306460 [Lactuca sativa]